MTARFVYWMNVSLDLRIEEVEGEDGGGDWMRIDDILHEECNTRARAFTAMVQGRRVYELMESFWPAAAEDASQSPVIREYGRIWTTMPKVLVSRTRASAPHRTRIVGTGGDAITELAALRAEFDGDIGVGGATIATALLHAALLDEVMLFTHPTVLGRGRGLFDDDPRVDLDLIEARTYGQGVVLQRYDVRLAR